MYSSLFLCHFIFLAKKSWPTNDGLGMLLLLEILACLRCVFPSASWLLKAIVCCTQGVCCHVSLSQGTYACFLWQVEVGDWVYSPSLVLFLNSDGPNLPCLLCFHSYYKYILENMNSVPSRWRLVTFGLETHAVLSSDLVVVDPRDQITASPE